MRNKNKKSEKSVKPATSVKEKSIVSKEKVDQKVSAPVAPVELAPEPIETAVIETPVVEAPVVETETPVVEVVAETVPAVSDSPVVTEPCAADNHLLNPFKPNL